MVSFILIYYYSDLCKFGIFVCVILCLVAVKMKENGNLVFDPQTLKRGLNTVECENANNFSS